MNSKTRSAEPDRLLTVREAAYLLAMEITTLYQWIHEGRIPSVKLGRSVRIRLSVIEQLIAESERPVRSIG